MRKGGRGGGGEREGGSEGVRRKVGAIGEREGGREKVGNDGGGK